MLPEEVGYIPNPEDYFRRNAASWSLGESANLVIGQGQMQITPAANRADDGGGCQWRDALGAVVCQQGRVDRGAPSYDAQPTAISVLDFAPSTFETIQDGMCQVTLDPNGTARYMFEDWYDFQRTDVVVCGKTGTAQTGGAASQAARLVYRVCPAG